MVHQLFYPVVESVFFQHKSVYAFVNVVYLDVCVYTLCYNIFVCVYLYGSVSRLKFVYCILVCLYTLCIWVCICVYLYDCVHILRFKFVYVYIYMFLHICYVIHLCISVHVMLSG